MMSALFRKLLARAALFAAAYGACASLSISQTHRLADLPKIYSLQDPRYQGMTVAKVGPNSISADEFLYNFEFGPSALKLDKDPKKHYLQFMIYEKLLAIQGYGQGLDQTPEARRLLGEFEGDMATEELYKEDVFNKVHVTKEAIRSGMNASRKHLTIEWLFSPDEQEIAEVENMLESGASFDSLYVLQFRGSVKPDERSMDETLFDLRMKNRALASVVDTLHAGERSLPIKAPDGYYIMKLVDVNTEVLQTETDLTKARHDVETALTQDIADSLSDNYVKAMMEDEQPAIQRRTFDIVQTYLAWRILPKETFEAWQLGRRLAERWKVTQDTDMTPYAAEQLVEGKAKSFTLDEFLQWYHAREYDIKPEIRTPEGFFGSCEQLVFRMVRDRLLSRRAYARNLQNDKAVREQMQWWRDKVTYALERRSIEDSIARDENVLYAYYLKNLRLFRGDKGDTLAYDKAKDDVWKNYFQDESTKILLHRILALKQKYKIQINDDVLNQLYVNVQTNSKPIDMYAVKKGGVYPRPAFPTVDYQWKTWN